MSNVNLTFILKKYNELPRGERWYANTIIPLWLSITIYMLIGVPIM